MRAADGDSGELAGHRLGDGVEVLGGHERTADGGALLAGLGGHLGDKLADVEVELLAAGTRVGTEEGEVERVGFGEEAGAALGHAGMGGERPGGGRRAGEGDGVLFAEVVEEVAGRPADELQRAFGQQAGFDDVGDNGVGELGAVGGRLDDDRLAGGEHRPELLQHPPDGEVEGVDLHGHSRTGGADVLAGEGLALRQPLDAAVEVDGRVRHLPAGDRGVGEQCRDAAVDVDEAIACRRAGGERDRVVAFAALVEVDGQGLEDDAALVEGQRAHGRPAGVAGVGDDG